MKKYLVYAHVSQDNRQVFYVGIGTRSRAYDEHSRSDEWKKVLKKTYFDVVILKDCLDRQDALNNEILFIHAFGLENLTNKSLGGKGTYGVGHSDETKKIISEKLKGRKVPKNVIDKILKTKRDVVSCDYRHIETGEIIRVLKYACDKFGIDYKLEHQRIRRNSYNKNFEKLE